MSNESLKDYARNAAINGAKAQQEAVGELVSAIHNKKAMLEREVMQLKQANSRLSAEKAALTKQMDVLRGVELGSVLTQLFKAKGPYKQDEQPYFILPDKREVFVNDARWKVDSQRGKGTIDLVMALRKYGQQDMLAAVGELVQAFGKEKTIGEFVGKALEQATETVKKAERLFTPKKEKQEQGMSR